MEYIKKFDEFKKKKKNVDNEGCLALNYDEIRTVV